MNKELIKKRFSRKLNSYNNNALIQKQMAEKLLSILPAQTFSSVLEIGCGTGLFTELVEKKIQYNNYYALDIVSECKQFIKKINPKIQFISEDVEKYIQNSVKKYDLIVSNASIQWIDNFPEFIGKLADKLNAGGLLLFSTFGKENFKELNSILGKTILYYSPYELELLLKSFSPKIEEDLQTLYFNTPREVLKHIHNTGVNAISAKSWTKKDLIEFEKQYNNICKNKPSLTYNPIYVTIEK